MEKETISITIKGIEKHAKENFSIICQLMGKSMNEVLKDFINGIYDFDSEEKLKMKILVLNKVIEEKPNLIDEFIIEQEPMFQLISQEKKKSFRNVYVYMNPTFYYEKYNSWLNEK